ncbi:MAG: beta strand repeat-containing protein [Thermoguttaceae bacterium]
MEESPAATDPVPAWAVSHATVSASRNFVLQFSNGSFVDLPVGGDGEPSGLSAIPGDVDVRPAIGETIIDAAQISDSLDWGIVVKPGARAAGSEASSPGSVSPLSIDNNPLDAANASLDQVGGVTLENNVISQFGDGGIDLLGDPDPAGEPTAAVSFFRVVNNTIYGGTDYEAPAGINVARNSAPTLLNNIIANVYDAVTVDATSTATVLGSTVYQNIADSATNAGIGLGTFPISLAPAAPLFVNAAAGNFYLAAGSQALNSAVDSLPDRPGMVTKETSLHLPQSPIIAPVFDALGQLRAATDPGAGSPPGEGSNILIDRGAIERVDFTPPTAIFGLVEPPADSLGGGVAPQWVADDDTVPAGQTLSAFAVQLLDSGAGIDNTTVSAADITVYRSDNPTTPLVDGTDYTYSYDPTDHIIYLAAVAGVWTGGYTYTIDVNNSAATGIKDIAGYALAANRSNGATSFTVTLVADANFSNAPGYPIAWHFITDNLYLGTVAPKPQATFVPSLTPANGDNGVDLSDVVLIQGQTTTVPVYVTNTTGNQAYLNAWIDLDDDGTFTADDQVVEALPVNPGWNQVSITIPASATVGATWARFRVSSTAALGPSGTAPDGEVEDYDNVLIDPAPVSVSGTVYNDIYDKGTIEANDPLLSGWTVFLDTNGSGKLAAGDPSAVTNASGAYALSVSFANVSPGTYKLLEVPPSGVVNFTPTQPAGGAYSLNIAAGAAYSGENFGNYYSVPPTVTSIVPEVPPDALLTNASSVQFVATFADPVTGVTAADFSPDVLSGSISGATISSVTPSSSSLSSTYIVTVSGITGNGALAIKLVDQPSVIEDVLSRPLSGAGSTAADPFVSQAFTIDQTPPTVASIVTTGASLTNASTVQYTVTFSKTVVGVGVNDFTLVVGAGLSGTSIASVAPGSTTAAASFVVTVNTGSGSGSLGLDVANGAATIADLAGNSLSGAGSGSTVYVGPAYTIDRVPPTVASIVTTGASLTNASTVQYTVTFSKTVVGVGASDFTLVPSAGLTGTSITSIAPGSTTPASSFVVTVNTGAGSGTLGLDVTNGSATIEDLVGNPLSGNGSGSTAYVGPTYTDRLSPTVASIVTTDANPTSASVVHYTVTFSASVVGVGVSDFTLVPGAGLSGTSIASIVPGSTTPASSFVVTVNTGTGSDTLGLDLVNGAATIEDLAGNPLSGNGSGSTAYVGPAYTIDRIPPTVASIVTTDANPTNASAVHYTVTFSENVVGVGANDFTLVPGAGLSGASIASIVPGSTTPASSFVVTVNTGAGSGTLGLDVVDGAATIEDLVGNPLSGNGSGSAAYVGPAYTIDRVAPTVASIITTDASPTNASAVHYTVTFSKIVVGVGINDFTLVPGAGLSGTSITSIVPGSTTPAASYVVTVNTGAGSDTLGLDVANGAATIEDLAGNPLSGNGSGSVAYVGPAYTIDRVAPTATINPSAGQVDPATSSPINFTAVFSEPVTGLSAAGIDLSLSSLSNLTATVTPVNPVNGFATTYNVAVTGMAGSGTVVAGIEAGAVKDAAGNLNPQSTTATVNFTSQPTVTVVQPATLANPSAATNSEPITFTVTFDQPVLDFTAADLSFTGSTAPGNLVGTITGSGPAYTVAVSGMTATGRVQLSIAADTVFNAYGQGNAASTGTANYIFYDIDPPTELLVNPAAGANVVDTSLNAQQYLEVAYSAQDGEGVNIKTITEAGPQFTLGGAAAAGVTITSFGISEGGGLFDYQFTGSFGDGAVTVNFIAGSFQDNAGNYNKAASYSFNVVSSASVDDVAVTKPANGSANAVFTALLSGPSSVPATVRYAAANGTSTKADADYTAKSGTTTPKTFLLNLSAPSNAVIKQSSAKCNIVQPRAALPAAAAVFSSPAAVTVGPKLSNSMVAAVAGMQASSTSNQKHSTTAVDAVFATLMNASGS